MNKKTVAIRETINRKEIADILQISLQRLSQLVYKDNRMPKPIDIEHNTFIYDKVSIMDWIASIHIKKSGPLYDLQGGIDMKQAKLFLKGNYDRSELRTKYEFKKFASRHTMPITTTVRIEGDF